MASTEMNRPLGFAALRAGFVWHVPIPGNPNLWLTFGVLKPFQQVAGRQLANPAKQGLGPANVPKRQIFGDVLVGRDNRHGGMAQ